jgi:ElaB/YqjD/DUF883 family membrane-anchored ribosome-binding protein
MNVKIEPHRYPAEYDLQEFDSQNDHASRDKVTALHRGKDKLLVDLKAVADDAQVLLKSAVVASAESVAGVPAFLENGLRSIKGRLQRAKDAMKTEAKNATAATNQYVKENPRKVIGLAGAVGVVVSILLVRAWIRAAGKAPGDEK